VFRIGQGWSRPGCRLALISPIEHRSHFRYAQLPDEQVELNRLLTGWSNYFGLGSLSKAYRAIDSHVSERLRRWLCKKHKTPGRGTARFSDEHLYQNLRLKRLTLTKRNLPWAKA
jgi:hypothetical protein